MERPEIVFQTNLKTAPKLPEAMATSVYRMIQEALLNAVKHADATKIGVKFECIKGQYRVEVSDNGKGMSEVVLERLFDPFFTDRPGGLGLGLTASQSILNGHGILLTVESEVGNGTTFTLHFPTELTH